MQYCLSDQFNPYSPSDRKVGILTLPLSSNYGGVFQAYALCRYLTDQGYKPVIINYRPKYRSFLRNCFVRFIARIPGQNIRGIRHGFLREKMLRRFIDLHFSDVSHPIETASELTALCEAEGFSALITGSDQVWRYAYTRFCFEHYFLDFAPRKYSSDLLPEKRIPIRKIAYGASFGTDIWEAPAEYQPKIKKLLADFTGISVRERTGVRLLKELGVNRSEHVLDPTLLHPAEFYRSLYQESLPLSGQQERISVVSYILDSTPKKEYIFQQLIVARSHHGFSDKSTNIVRLENGISGKLSQGDQLAAYWLYAIDQADYVMTDSFHGVVFSLIFRKNFIVFTNPDRGSTRITDLLDILGLSGRLLNPAEAEQPDLLLLLTEVIDYQPILSKLDALIVQSEHFLKSSLTRPAEADNG